MSTAVSSPPGPTRRAGRALQRSRRWQTQREGIAVLVGIVGLMWLVEIVNTIDGNRLDQDGIYARSLPHLWGIITSPFIHASLAPHLLDNTIPLLFLGVIIALRGARRVLLVTAIVILLGGLGTWLIGPSGESTIGASGLVFGYATYLLTRGFFDRSLLELLTAVVVGVLWGGTLLSSLIPHSHVSWQAHLCGGIAGVVAAWWLAQKDGKHPGRRVLGRSAATQAAAR
jgi:membrane associated rhomboid family serine protease